MTLLAKQIVKNKCWIVEENGTKVASIIASSTGVTFVRNNKRENFNTLKLLSNRYNIIVDKRSPQKVIKETHEIYGYPCDHRTHNVLWDVPKKLPIFTKSLKSKSFFCAGYYIIQFNVGWVEAYCPKFITLNRYKYHGPFKTDVEMQHQLKEANGAIYGITTKSASEEF